MLFQDGRCIREVPEALNHVAFPRFGDCHCGHFESNTLMVVVGVIELCHIRSKQPSRTCK